VVLGEVGLGGEVRNIFRLEERLKEAERLGFKAALVPNADIKSGKLKLIKIKNLDDLVEFIK
jgi:DNA repair protein RadA/Sms